MIKMIQFRKLFSAVYLFLLLVTACQASDEKVMESGLSLAEIEKMAVPPFPFPDAQQPIYGSINPVSDNAVPELPMLAEPVIIPDMLLDDYTEVLSKPDTVIPEKRVPHSKTIVIVIDDMGVSPPYTKAVSNLPYTITAAFLPYAAGVQAQADYAKAKGHDIMLHLPMEAFDGSNFPGRNALYTRLNPAEIKQRVRWNFEKFTGWSGFNNHMGSRFTSDYQKMARVMQAAKGKTQFFLDSKTIGSTKGQLAANAYGIPYLGRDVFIDHVDSVKSVMKQLRAIERCAVKKGSCIAIGHPRANTIKALRIWMPQAERNGFTFAGITDLLTKNLDIVTAHDN